MRDSSQRSAPLPINAAIKVVIGILLVALIVRFARGLEWGLLRDRLGAADAPLIGLAAAILLGRLVSWHLRWSATLNQADDRTPGGRRFAILMASVITNHVVPSMRVAGGLVRARYVARGGGLSFGQAYATVLYDTTLHHVTGSILTWLTLVGAAFALDYAWVGLVVAVAGSGVLIYLGVRLSRDDPFEGLVARYLRRLQSPGGRLSKWVHKGRGLFEMARHLVSRKRLLIEVPFFSLLWVVLSVAAQWILFRALGLEVGFWTAAAAIGSGVLATVLTQTPGGIGSTEAAMVAVYSAFGIEQVDALAGTLLFRGLHYLLVLALGLPSLLLCEISRPSDNATKL